MVSLFYAEKTYSFMKSSERCLFNFLYKGSREMRGNVQLQKLALKSKGFAKRNSSTILTCIGALGVVTTAVMTAKAAPKARDILERAEKEKGEKLTAFEKVNVTAPVYIPAVVSGTVTIACIFGANILNKRKQAALISAYGVLDQSYKEYKKKVDELYGEGSDAEIRHELAKDKYTGKEEKHPVSDESVRFFDQYSNRYFWSTMEDVRNAEYHLNRNFALRGYSELNEFYEFLGLEPTPYGAEVGWSLEAGAQWYGYTWIDFCHEYHEAEGPDEPAYYSIETPFEPTADFMLYY